MAAGQLAAREGDSCDYDGFPSHKKKGRKPRGSMSQINLNLQKMINERCNSPTQQSDTGEGLGWRTNEERSDQWNQWIRNSKIRQVLLRESYKGAQRRRRYAGSVTATG
jgi:hypothetical protein